MEGQNAVAEVAHRRHAGPWIAENAHRTDVRAAFPASNEAAATKNFPAVGISDSKRQAAIGKTISRRIHPAALDRSRTDVQFVSFQNIGGEFHAIHIWQNIPEVSDRSCLSERLPYTVTRRTCEVCSRQGSPILCPRAACLSVPVVLVSANHSYPQLSTAGCFFYARCWDFSHLRDTLRLIRGTWYT